MNQFAHVFFWSPSRVNQTQVAWLPKPKQYAAWHIPAAEQFSAIGNRLTPAIQAEEKRIPFCKAWAGRCYLSWSSRVSNHNDNGLTVCAGTLHEGDPGKTKE